MEKPSLVRELKAEADKLLACVHCGLCLPHCPTYAALGDENDSPRGRLYLMRAVAEGRLSPDSRAFVRHLDLCLGCRACETVCPSGVHYGHLLEIARWDIVRLAATPDRGLTRVTRFVLNHLFTSPRRLRLVLGFVRRLRDRGLIELLLESGLLASLPGRVRKGLAMVLATQPSGPPVAASSATHSHGGSTRVALFAGCVVRELFAHTNQATERVLVEHGCDVDDPPDQVCCGALHAHAGERETAQRLARRNVEIFERGDYDAIIVNAAGCGAMLKEYPALLADDAAYRQRAEAFSARVKDICEFLIERGFRPGPRPLHVRVTYDAPCHLYHAQRITDAPIALITQLPGVEFVPLPHAEMCCGSGGIYNLMHPELADDILARKLEAIRSTGADIVLTGNAGCLMHIGSGARLAGFSFTLLHPVELIAQTY